MSTDSNQNPYAVPESPLVEAVAVAPTGSGGPQPWSTAEVLSTSYDLFKKHWPGLLGGLFVYVLVVFGTDFVLRAVLGVGVFQQDVPPGKQFLLSVLGFPVSTFMAIGLTRFGLGIVRGGAPEIGLLFSGGDRWVTGIFATLLYLLAVLVGLVVLIVPGLIVAIGLSLESFLVADGRDGAVDLLKKSWALTDGSKAKIFGFGVASFLLLLAGAIACGVGVLVAAPVTFLGYCLVYTRMTGTGPGPKTA